MKRGIIAVTVVVCGAGLAACSSGSSSSPSASASSSAAQTLAQVCTQVNQAMTRDIPDDPTAAAIEKATTSLTTISATASPEAQAALAPLITGMNGLKGIDLNSPTPPPAYETFITAATAFKTSCEKAGVTFTPSASASAS